jgi:hypothetical protein
MKPKPTLPSEAALLELFATRFATRRRDVRIGVGDDSAVVRLAGDAVLTTDTLVEDVDFRGGCDAHALGRKALAASLSDLAARVRPRHRAPHAGPSARNATGFPGRAASEIAGEWSRSWAVTSPPQQRRSFIDGVGRPQGPRVLWAGPRQATFSSSLRNPGGRGRQARAPRGGYRVSAAGTLTNPAGRAWRRPRRTSFA